MLKTYTLHLPLDIDESFSLVRASGEAIVSWGANNMSEEDHYLEWKQSFWSLTGTSLVSVTLAPAAESGTTVTVRIHKPMQVVDPFGIRYRIYRKLEKSIQKNLDARAREENSGPDDGQAVTRDSDEQAG